MIDKKDLKIVPTKGTGNGGQHRNKTLSACRVIHLPTRITVTIDGRCFHRNKKNALRVMEKRVAELEKQKVAAVKKDHRDFAIHNTRTIRTYNFSRQTVKDHRSKRTANLATFLNGKVDLHEFSDSVG